MSPAGLVGIVPKAKITDCLLDVDHAVGGSKARFFLSMGFSLAAWEHLAQALRERAARNPLMEAKPSGYGTVHVVRCSIVTPNGRDPCIRSIWMGTGVAGGVVRLVTAYPDAERAPSTDDPTIAGRTAVR